ncbi:MAG: ATP-dependent helicase, partial [Promethearchaeota archaeon]
STDGEDEINFIVDEIESLLDEQKTLNNFVVLYRTNAQSRIIEEVLLKRNIPYRIVGAVQFYQRKEIKDILAYLRLIVNPNDEVSMERIINVPARGIGAKTLEQFPISNFQFPNKSQCPNLKIRKFLEMMEGFRNKSKELTSADLIEYVVNVSGYKKMLIDERTEQAEMRLENIEELKSVASKYARLKDFLQEVALISDVDNYNANQNVLTLMTLHNAKGLEFPVVFITGVEEGLFPHSRSLTEPSEMEEERRLAYVGITRAKERLYLTYAQSRLIYGNIQSNIPSRFIDEIPDEYKEII